ncbi:hypothetical protein [Enterobacter asburiae]|uniref:hypothetical protein n=1 Tax=Enterobacter asburiae TaxID=61645 RepID=UPI0021C67411|nr:hypothetical protein [Enterobacter asburiae]MCU3443779.1 hypothetical protein [Enterobacter asburiae]
MNNKELINAGHALAKAISNDTPLIEIAKMVSNLATQLDVQLARSNALAAENAGLKAAIVEHSQRFTVCRCCGTENDCSHDDVCRAVNEVPETDSFLSELRAVTIETCADDLVSKNDIGGYEIDAMYVYAENLRKGVQP